MDALTILFRREPVIDGDLVETDAVHSVRGTWTHRDDGLRALRVTDDDVRQADER